MLKFEFKLKGCDPEKLVSQDKFYPELAQEIVSVAEEFFERRPECRAVELDAVEITRNWLVQHRRTVAEKAKAYEEEREKRSREKELREMLKNHDISVSEYLRMTEETEEAEGVL